MEMNFDELTELEKEILRPFLKKGEHPSFLNPKVVDGLVNRGLLTAYYNEGGFVFHIKINDDVLEHLSEHPSILD